MKNHEPIKATDPKKVLVTGGGGFLGSAIVTRLVERKYHVRSFSRSPYPELSSMGIEQIQGDICNKSEIEHALRGVDLVFHTAAKAGIWGNYSDYYRTNVTGTQNVIAGCKKHHISRLIYTSSPSVVFNGTDMEGVNESVPYPATYHAYYPQTKAIAEQVVIKAAGQGLMTIILRPHLIWGPGDKHFVPRIIARANRLVRVGNGKNLIDTIYIDNAADAHILAADALEKNPKLSGNIYFISQGDPVPLWDMINHILKAAGLAPVRRSMPRNMAWLIGVMLELVYRSFNISKEPRMTRFLADELAKAHWFDISAAGKDLGYAPRISIKEGLRRLERWLQNKQLE
ncbi:MAG: NAD-dependent epimerase/dehydratase family protein [Deltaproteobacteria bacterium]|nr:NAD-dependent epimerase/dehydratase family protein [Deltaproteobacteria bacterium]MBW2680952.1 NAD-dependent epimerase/dehydratase family protein [Deltaproteobacteria bacterium]